MMKQIGGALSYLDHAYEPGKPLMLSSGSDLLEESETLGGLGGTQITTLNCAEDMLSFSSYVHHLAPSRMHARVLEQLSSFPYVRNILNVSE